MQTVEPDAQPISQLWRYILHPGSGVVEDRQLFLRALEYPSVNQDYTGGEPAAPVQQLAPSLQCSEPCRQPASHSSECVACCISVRPSLQHANPTLNTIESAGSRCATTKAPACCGKLRLKPLALLQAGGTGTSMLLLRCILP